MKKVFIGAGMLVAMLCAGLQSEAIGIKLGGITIKFSFERGIKEWNRDHTATFCVGKGICAVSVDISFGIPAQLGTDENGKLLILIPTETADQYSGDFEAGSTYPVEELDLSPALVKSLGFPNGVHVRKGQYPVEKDISGRYFCIQLQ